MPRIFTIDEDFDAAAVTTLKPAFEELAAGDEDVVLDLSRVEFLDSSGVGAIVFLYKRLRARGLMLLLRDPKGQPLGLLSHLRMMDLVEGKRPAGEAA